MGHLRDVAVLDAVAVVITDDVEGLVLRLFLIQVLHVQLVQKNRSHGGQPPDHAPIGIPQNAVDEELPHAVTTPGHLVDALQNAINRRPSKPRVAGDLTNGSAGLGQADNRQVAVVEGREKQFFEGGSHRVALSVEVLTILGTSPLAAWGTGAPAPFSCATVTDLGER